MIRTGDSDNLGNRAIATSACRLRSPPAPPVSMSVALGAITDALEASFLFHLIVRRLRHWREEKLGGSGLEAATAFGKSREEMASGTKSLLRIGSAFDIWSKQDEDRRALVRCGLSAVFYVISAYPA